MPIPPPPKITTIIPSLLTDNYADFAQRLKLVENEVAMVQIDVIDGVFCGQKTFASIAKISAIKTPVKWEVQLMVQNLDYYLSRWISFQPTRIIIPYESAGEKLSAYIKKIKQAGIQAGVQIEPATSVQVLAKVWREIDLIMLMTVPSGYAGQKFNQDVLQKAVWLKKDQPQIKLGVDGGVNTQTIVWAKQAGIDYFSVNSAIFSQAEPVSALRQLAELVK